MIYPLILSKLSVKFLKNVSNLKLILTDDLLTCIKAYTPRKNSMLFDDDGEYCGVLFVE